MSTIRANTNEGVFRITKFLGLNENPDGDTKLRLGEASRCTNWRITRDLNLKRRPGTKTLYDFQTESPVMGLWYGKVNGKDTGLAASGGHMWKFYEDDYLAEPEDLGKISTNNRVNFFAYSGIVYILNGEDYYEYDGVRFGPVIGYRPLIVVSRTPDGSQSTLNEEVNKLNGIRRVWFSPDGKDAVFTLPEKDLVSIDYVKLTESDTYVDPTTYVRDRSEGTVTFIGSEVIEADGIQSKYTLTNPRVASVVVRKDGDEIAVELDKNDNSIFFLRTPDEGSSIVVTETKVETEEQSGNGETKIFYFYKNNVVSVEATVDDVSATPTLDSEYHAVVFEDEEEENEITKTGDGHTKEWTLDGKRAYTDATATVNDTAVTVTFDKATQKVTFETAPANNASVKIKGKYKVPTAPGYKEYTFTGDGTTTEYVIDDYTYISTTATVDGVLTAITYDKDTHKVKFSTAPANDKEIIIRTKRKVKVVLTEHIETSETFEGDGTEYKFYLVNKGYELSVTIDGVPDNDYMFDEETNTIVFYGPPVAGELQIEETLAPERKIDSIEIGYTAAGTFRQEVARMTNAELFLGSQDNAVFLYGDGSNEALYSGIDYNGKPRADYFPDLNEMAVADKNTPITALVRHYSQMICFKSDSTYSVHFGTITTALGQTEYGFYVTPINRAIGCDALGQVQIVNNSPYVLHGENLYEWRNTSSYSSNLTIDERQAKTISNRIFNTLSTFKFSDCYCFDDNNLHEYYVCYKDRALVYNYDADAWYYYTGWNVKTMCNTDDKLLYGSADGKVYEISDDYLNDDGVAIDSYWESGSIDFGKDYMRKLMTELWIGFKPEERTYVMVTVQTNKKSEYTKKEITHNLSTFDHMNFGAFSFIVNRKPQVKKLKIKAKKFAFMKLLFVTKDLYTTATILSADPKIRETGFMK